MTSEIIEHGVCDAMSHQQLMYIDGKNDIAGHLIKPTILLLFLLRKEEGQPHITGIFVRDN